ncbi:MAG: hypothetical protein ACXWB0_07880 [Sulfuricurvum sp.]
MSKNNLREALLAQFIEPPYVNLYLSYRRLPATRKGKTLADFYQEVLQVKKPSQENKSAKEIEIMMMQNRKLIEAKHKRR